MVGVDVNRELAEKEFEYGNHRIVVKVKLRYNDLYSHQNILNYNITLKQGWESHYYRRVKVMAWKGDDCEIKNESYVVLDEEKEVSRLFGGKKVKNKVINVRDHISETVRPVFERLDEVYQYTTEGESIEIDAATHEVQAETSWVEVEDEIDRLSKEIEELTGGQTDE